jgi:hypothetical protein
MLDPVLGDLPRAPTYHGTAAETFSRLRDRIWRDTVNLGVKERSNSG